MSVINLKGSKSIINRLLIICLYNNNELVINNINLCNDVLEILKIYDTFNKKYILNKANNSLKIFKSKEYFQPQKSINLIIEESGTALRFILPFLAFYKVVESFDDEYFVILKTGKILSSRPIDKLIECLSNAGAEIFKRNEYIYIKPFNKNIYRLFFNIDSSQSSQFLSSLLLFSINPNFKSFVNPTTQTVSISYVSTTIKILHKFGYEISKQDNCYSCNKSVQTSLSNFTCDPDYSTAIYYWIFGILTNKQVYINVSKNNLQADYKFIYILKKLCIRGIKRNNKICFLKQKSENPENNTLKIYMHNMPDQIISLAFLTLYLKQPIIIYGFKTLNQKESKRLDVIIENIRLLGGTCNLFKNKLEIIPTNDFPEKCNLKTHNDHRFAMIFSVLKIIASIDKSYPEITLDNTDCINKSYPEFISLLNEIN